MFKQTSNTDIEWIRLQEMTSNMLDAAKQSDWEEMFELNESRQAMIENYFTEIAPALNDELIRDRIHILQAMEQQISQYSYAMRENVAKKLKNLHRGKQVEQAYSSYAA